MAGAIHVVLPLLGLVLLVNAVMAPWLTDAFARIISPLFEPLLNCGKGSSRTACFAVALALALVPWLNRVHPDLCGNDGGVDVVASVPGADYVEAVRSLLCQPWVLWLSTGAEKAVTMVAGVCAHALVKFLSLPSHLGERLGGPLQATCQFLVTTVLAALWWGGDLLGQLLAAGPSAMAALLVVVAVPLGLTSMCAQTPATTVTAFSAPVDSQSTQGVGVDVKKKTTKKRVQERSGRVPNVKRAESLPRHADRWQGPGLLGFTQSVSVDATDPQAAAELQLLLRETGKRGMNLDLHPDKLGFSGEGIGSDPWRYHGKEIDADVDVPIENSPLFNGKTITPVQTRSSTRIKSSAPLQSTTQLTLRMQSLTSLTMRAPPRGCRPSLCFRF